MKNEWDPRQLDVRAFARAGGHLQGQSELSQWQRLAPEAAQTDGSVQWTLSGSTRAVTLGQEQIWLEVRAQLDIALTCQRCLSSVRYPLQVERAFRFVADETVAIEEDEHSEEDVLAWSHRFDALELLEDELIMVLPMIPMHEDCQGEHVLTSKDEPESEVKRPNPFAVLSSLRKDGVK